MNKSTILAISAHPDDETLGCGGTLLKHKMQGDDINWLIFTTPELPSQKVSSQIADVSGAYGMHEVQRLNYHTTSLRSASISQLIDVTRHMLYKVFKPDVVYLIHGGDAHTDHHAVFTASMMALKPIYMQRSGVKRVLCFETLSSTEAAPPTWDAFRPNVFVDISPVIDKKLGIMELYETEEQEEPLPRSGSSIRALARHRGATIGVDYAEAFMLMREIK